MSPTGQLPGGVSLAGPLSTSNKEKPMTTATISPWPLVGKGDQHHPVKTLASPEAPSASDLTGVT